MFAYAGITVGDIVSGLISQLLRSRKKALTVFLSLTVVGVVLYFLFGGTSVPVFYTIVTFIGFATGYWAVFISTASELFGTNLRATVTTTAPNFVRGSVTLMALASSLLMPHWSNPSDGRVYASIIIGIVVFTLAYIACYKLEETFAKDLNYTE